MSMEGRESDLEPVHRRIDPVSELGSAPAMYISSSQLYNASMSRITASEARKSFASVIETAQREAVTVERRGEAQAVIVSAAEYDRLRSAAQEIEDITAFDAAMAEEGPNIPWEQVKADLGW